LVRIQPADGSQALVSEGGLFRYPLGVALDSAGQIVFANECGDPGLARVLSALSQSVLATNNAVDVLVTPERLALDPAGDFLVSDWSLGDGDGGIVRVDSQTGAQKLVRGGELFNHPLGIAAVVNRPPSAALRAPSAVAAGNRVILNASASRDPEGLRLVYEWDLNGDGSFELGTGARPVVARAWRRNGPVTVRVRVNDPHGGRSLATAAIAVDGSTPRITRLARSAGVLGVGPRGRGARRLPRATTIRFRLSEPAAVHLTLQRARFGGRKTAPRELTKAGRAGLNQLRLRARGLRPGKYKLLVGATDAVGHHATARKLELRVVSLRSRSNR
jgi:hypothetical protein